MQTILTFIIIFCVIVTFHEFGHFYFAKKSGILVREFAIGMGPKIFSHQGKDGTAYTVRVLPLGGYVRMAGWGEDEEDIKTGTPVGLKLNSEGIVTQISLSDKGAMDFLPLTLTAYDLVESLTITGLVNNEEQTYSVDHDATIIEKDGTKLRIAPLDVQFQSAKLSQRMLTNFAGPMNNFILGIILFMILTFVQGGVPTSSTNRIGEVTPNSPAAQAGLKEDDAIISANQKKIKKWSDLANVIEQSKGKEMTLKVKRNNKTFAVSLKAKVMTVNGQKSTMIGISQPLNRNFIAKVTGGFSRAFDVSFSIFKALGSLITKPDLNKLGGPVMIFELSSQVSKQGWQSVVALMAALSMNLGIFNLLPIPALDGGKLLMNIIEGVRGKPLSQEKEGIITIVGMVLMVILMILVTWNDIFRFINR
ncbi:MAG: RIP metalloprotease RseP [Streptococcaceae bacterium]|jgi:regulator of sigma E protease|nr:RIP metalloprotease RseP [Streptococcaceae bacterium]